jgi:uncharacterized membrane protein YqhA
MKAISLTRWMSGITILSSLISALLMFLLGASNTIKALFSVLNLNLEILESSATETPPSINLLLLEGLDNALTGLTFLYFAYGIYSLFLTDEESMAAAPSWLQINNLSALKKTLLEVVVVLLSIVFVKTLAEKLLANELQWEIIIFPIAIVAISLSIKLIGFEESPE